MERDFDRQLLQGKLNVDEYAVKLSKLAHGNLPKGGSVPLAEKETKNSLDHMTSSLDSTRGNKQELTFLVKQYKELLVNQDEAKKSEAHLLAGSLKYRLNELSTTLNSMQCTILESDELLKRLCTAITYLREDFQAVDELERKTLEIKRKTDSYYCRFKLFEKLVNTQSERKSSTVLPARGLFGVSDAHRLTKSISSAFGFGVETDNCEGRRDILNRKAHTNEESGDVTLEDIVQDMKKKKNVLLG
mmetsp:Transcript_4872/g.5630  ORF Transcript_4872/g.5630 Transcript_4872/m.5630 type:complete len:246 (+) Transcript_4872:65-802(+)